MGFSPSAANAPSERQRICRGAYLVMLVLAAEPLELPASVDPRRVLIVAFERPQRHHH